MQAKAISLKGKTSGPVVCAPLVARGREQLLAEAATVAAKQPDLLEWRVDFFEGIADTAQVVELVGRIKQAAGGIPLLFTRRSVREGGEQIPLSEPDVVSLYRAVCAGGQADLVDFEMSSDPAHLRQVREFSRAAGAQLVLSFHNFQRTPPLEDLAARFAQAQQLRADIAKIAVMPRSREDVLTLLSATLQASQKLDIPVVGMAMGGLGALTRVCGWHFGSAMTFAVGANSSAPGQMPIEDVRAGLALLQKASG